MSNCTECILDLTDACVRGAGRAIDDEICDSFIPRDQVSLIDLVFDVAEQVKENKNE